MTAVGGRLSMSDALSRHRASDSSGSAERETTSGETNSASLAKAEREIKVLKAENIKLKSDLQDVRSLYGQLIKENTHEKFDERRVNLLKSQVIQLERQILLLSEGLGAKSTTLLEVENALTWLADKCRSYIAMEIKGPDVKVSRSDLMLMVETSESAQIKLYKNLEATNADKIKKPLKFMNSFIREEQQGEVTLLDIASGNLDFLNLKHVSKLESKLSSLYRDLIALHEVLDSDTKSDLHTKGHLPQAVTDYRTAHRLKCCARLKDCTSDLLNLSLLFPAAPWPPLKRPVLPEITMQMLQAKLPSLNKQKHVEVSRLLEALIKAVNYRHYMYTHEVKSLRDELHFHQAVYDLHLQYTKELFDAVRIGYKTFEDSCQTAFCKPVTDVLESYKELKNTGSENGLRDFLTSFKHNADQLASSVESLAVNETGSSELSSFGEHFFSSLDVLVQQCQQKRDAAAHEKDEIRLKQEKLETSLRELLKTQDTDICDNLEQISERLSNCNINENDVTNIDSQGDIKNYSSSQMSASNRKVFNKSPSTDASFENSTNQRENVTKSPKETRSVSRTKTPMSSRAPPNKTPSAIKGKPLTSSLSATDEKKAGRRPPYAPSRTLHLHRSGSISKLPQSEMDNVSQPRSSAPNTGQAPSPSGSMENLSLSKSSKNDQDSRLQFPKAGRTPRKETWK